MLKCQEITVIAVICNNYTTRNLLSRQANTSIPQQISFKGKFKNMILQQCFFFSKKQQKHILDFSLDLLNVTE